MTFLPRVCLLAALLAACGGARYAFFGYLEAGGPPPAGELQAPLAELPRELGEWTGVDRAIEDERALYGDDHLQRLYTHGPSGTQAMVWIAYSRTGADRGHHPEVCMAVAGQPEDTAARRTLEVPGHAAPVQQYRFGRTGSFQYVFYWHYALPSRRRENSELRLFYQRLRHPTASVTLEVFAPGASGTGEELPAELVRLVDAAMQRLVGERALRGISRKPVTLVGEAAE